MSRQDLKQIEKEVTEDLRFDYGEDELDIFFDGESVRGVLHVVVQDHFDFEAAGEGQS